MKTIKFFIKDWLPPAITRAINSIFNHHRANNYQGNYLSWVDARSNSTGYNHYAILDKVLQATLKVKQGEAACERDSVLFNEIEYSWPVIAGLMWAAARHGGDLRVLDFGGSLGSSYFQSQKFLSRLLKIRWCIVEQPHYVEAGRAMIQTDQLQFFTSIEACQKSCQPNTILLSSVLQYLEFPYKILSELSSLSASCLIIDRTAFSDDSSDRILIQNTPPQIYTASYPMRVFSRHRFLQEMSENWSLVATSSCPEGRIEIHDGTSFVFEGMIFERK